MVRAADRRNTRPSGWNWTRFTLSDGAVAVMVTGASSAPAGIDSACGPIPIPPPAGPTVCVAVAVGIGVQPSRPVACRSEPIRLACGGGATGPSGGSPQPSSAAAVMTSAARLRRVTFMAVSSGTREPSCASPGDGVVREVGDLPHYLLRARVVRRGHVVQDGERVGRVRDLLRGARSGRATVRVAEDQVGGSQENQSYRLEADRVARAPTRLAAERHW